MKETNIYIYGKHAVSEAIAHTPDIVQDIFFVGSADEEIRLLAKKKGITFTIIQNNELPRTIHEDAVHQNCIAKIDISLLVVDYKEFIDTLEISKKTGLVVLGEIQDPQNVGAVIRSAAAFGISGVLIPEHNQASVTASVIKVSAGMAFRIPLVSIGNVNTVLEDLKKHGFWIYGLAGESSTSISDESFDAASVLVLGNEGRGIREKTREHCDILLSIPMDKKCESLNAAVSAGIVLHEWNQKKAIQR